MKYRIIADSCVDFNEEAFGDPNKIKRVPFQLLIDDEALTDEGLGSDELIWEMKTSKRRITTVCSPLHDYLEAYKSCVVNYVATISSRLNGSFQSAMAAKQTLEEPGSTSKVYVIDNKFASVGQTLVVLQFRRTLEQWTESSQILLRLSHYITHLQTLPVLVSLNSLEKNSRVKGIQVIVSKVFHTIPILGSSEDGILELKEKAHGGKQAMEKLLNIIQCDVINMTESVLAITHVDARAKVEKLCEKIKSLFSFREVIILQANGLSMVYADDGGIVLSF